MGSNPTPLAKPFREFLLALRDRGPCKLTGSFARGEEDAGDHVSDIDLACPDKTYDDFGDVVDSPIDRCKAVFVEFGVPWDSVVVGSISSPRDLVTLPRPVEILEEQWASQKWRPPIADSVAVYGVEFDTF